MFNMGFLGDFDRDVFSSDFENMLFVSYVTLVVIVMLNVLIAIVSDSYGALLFCVNLCASNVLLGLNAPHAACRECDEPFAQALSALAAGARSGSR